MEPDSNSSNQKEDPDPRKKYILESKRFYKGLCNDDNTVIREIYDTYFPLVLKYGKGFKLDYDSCQEAFQDTISDLYISLRRKNSGYQEKGRFFFYFLTTFRRKCYTLCKKKGEKLPEKKELEKEFKDLFPDMESGFPAHISYEDSGIEDWGGHYHICQQPEVFALYEHEDSFHRLETFLSSLPPRDAALIRYHILEGKSLESYAIRNNTSAVTMRQRKRRLLQSFKNNIRMIREYLQS